jgi:hypothetical protein
MVSLPYALEQSITDYLISVCDPLEATASYYTGLGNVEELEAPSVFITCDNGIETYPYSSVYDLTVNIAVKEMAADTTSGSLGVLSFNIYNAICDPNMKKKVNLNNSYSFCSQFIQKLDAKHSARQDALISDYTIRVIGSLSGSWSSSQSPLPT